MTKQNNLVVENARILFRNFSGKEGRFNPAGRRNFCVILETELANILLEEGWNVKWLEPRDVEDTRQAYLQVSVNFNNFPPKILLITSRGKTLVTEDTASMLDWAEIENVDLIIRPYEWEVSGKTGIKAYVKSMYITIVEDEFEHKYGTMPLAGESVDGDTNLDLPFEWPDK